MATTNTTELTLEEATEQGRCGYCGKGTKRYSEQYDAIMHAKCEPLYEASLEAPVETPARDKWTNATRPKVTVAQLIEQGTLKVGQKLTATYKGEKVDAKLATKDGDVDYDGVRYGSLSAAAKAVRGGGYYVSGWSFWSLADGTKLDALR